MKKLSLLFFYVAIFSGVHAKQNGWNRWRVKGGVVVGKKTDLFWDMFEMSEEKRPSFCPILTIEKGLVLRDKIYLGGGPWPLAFASLVAVLVSNDEINIKEKLFTLSAGLILSIDAGYVISDDLLIKTNPALIIGGIVKKVYNLPLILSYKINSKWSVEGTLIPIVENKFEILAGAAICYHF